MTTTPSISDNQRGTKREARVLFIASSLGMGLTWNLARLAINLHESGQAMVVIWSNREQESGLAHMLTETGVSSVTQDLIDGERASRFLEGAKELATLLRREQVDVIHANGLRQLIAAYVASRIMNGDRQTALVTTIHSTLNYASNERLGLVILSVFLGLLSDVAITVCDATKNDLPKLLLTKDKVQTVHNGIDLREFDRESVKSDYAAAIGMDLEEETGPIIGCFATLNSWKGHAYLIDASPGIVREFPEARFVIAGDGPLRTSLERRCRQLGLEKNFVFAGNVQSRHIYQIARRLDVYVFPSLAELFPYAVLEPMAGAKPVVATNVGGISEAVKDGVNGFIVPPRDSDALADKTRTLLRNPDLARSFGINARATIEREFSMDVIVSRLKQIYEDARQRRFRFLRGVDRK